MGIISGPNNFGLFNNGDFRQGTNTNFSFGEYVSKGGPDGGPYIQIVGGGGGGWTGDRIEVDPSKYYKMSAYARTFKPGTSGNNAGGHIGFACYDQFDNFVDLRNCGDIGNTYLSRDANPGDSVIYFQDSNNWYTGADVTNNTYYFRQILFFPASHPYYGVPHKYTRFNGMYYSSMVQTGQGDWEVTLQNGTLPDYGYPLPAGTPVSRGVAGGSYNYCLGAPTYPNTWQRYETGVFTGENRNSGTPFRYSTKYIRFLILRNYNRRTESPQDHVWGMAKIFFGEVDNGRNYNYYNIG